MRAFKLREQKTFVKVLKEPPAAKKKFNWNRALYLTILIVVALLFVKRVYMSFALISADGQIELPKQVVNFSNDIQLVDIRVEEGAPILVGDTLFSYRVLNDEATELSFADQNSPIDWIIKERLKAMSQKQMLAMEQSRLQTRLQLVNEMISIKESLVSSGLHRELKALEELEQEKSDLEVQINMSKGASRVHDQMLVQLTNNESMYNELRSRELSYYSEVRYFISDFSGIAGSIPYQIQEICFKKDDLLTIHSTFGPTINTYFDPIELEYLQEGDEVEVIFPDGSEGRGVINKFFVSTYALPSEFQKKYEPTERNIVAEVVPLNKSEESIWKNYYKMDVRILKKRFTLWPDTSEKRRILTENRISPV